MQNQIFMDTRTEEMDFFRPLSRAFFRIQTLDKCINIRLESWVCIRMKIPAVRFCIKDRIIDLKNSEKNGTRKVYGDRISPYMFIKRSISRKICNVRSSSMKLFNEFILLLNRCIIKEHSGKIKSGEMTASRGKIVFLSAIYDRAANQVLMLAVVTFNFETSSPLIVCLRHKFAPFPPVPSFSVYPAKE